PFDESVVGEVGLGDASDLESAISGAAAAFKGWSRSPTHTRALVLDKLALAIEAESEALARLIARESGKPIRYAKAEVARPVLSFTGSDSVGWHLEGVARRKHVLLELGGNAPCLIDETVDLEVLLPRVVDASFANAGQVCIKAQRLFVVRERFRQFVDRFVAL